MARIELAPNVTDIRGSFKNVVFSIWKSGKNYIRSKAGVISNPNSEDQAAARFTLQSSGANWITLTQAQRDAWEEMAQRLRLPPFMNNNGGVLNITPRVGGIMSGFNAYVGFRTAAFGAGLFAFFSDDPPLQGPQPRPPRNLAGSYASGPGTLTLTWTDPAGADPDAKIRIWVRSRERLYHRQLLTFEAIGVGTIDLTQAKGALGAFIPFLQAHTSKLLVQIDHVDITGFRSQGSNTIDVSLS